MDELRRRCESAAAVMPLGVSSTQRITTCDSLIEHTKVLDLRRFMIKDRADFLVAAETHLTKYETRKPHLPPICRGN